MGIISKTLAWITHPSKSEGTPAQWLAGLVLILILAFCGQQLSNKLPKEFPA